LLGLELFALFGRVSKNAQRVEEALHPVLIFFELGEIVGAPPRGISQGIVAATKAPGLSPLMERLGIGLPELIGLFRLDRFIPARPVEDVEYLAEAFKLGLVDLPPGVVARIDSHLMT